MDEKTYKAVLTQHADDRKRPYESALTDFMDFCLNLFDVQALSGTMEHYKQHLITCSKEYPAFYALATNWLNEVANSMDRGEWFDLFGSLYESLYLSRGKASHKGQFFTPRGVSDLMATTIWQPQNECTVNDCAAGSGRLLLSHFIDRTKNDHAAAGRYKYVAQDSDPVACKMCALNMMAHGMYGTVICQDTLAMSVPTAVYHVNEVRHPFPTPYYSVRVESSKQQK